VDVAQAAGDLAGIEAGTTPFLPAEEQRVLTDA